jgi:hypothetical protein
MTTLKKTSHNVQSRKSTALNNWKMGILKGCTDAYTYHPVRIRVRIDPPHPLVCRKRRLNGAVHRMRPEKPRSRVTAGVAR